MYRTKDANRQQTQWTKVYRYIKKKKLETLESIFKILFKKGDLPSMTY